MSIDNNLYEKSIKILTDLIAFKTISGQDNSNLIDYCEKILNNIGIDTFKVYDDDKKRVNLFGTLKAKNQSSKKPIILSGHTDVVPVSNGWSSDPFKAVIKGKEALPGGADNYLYRVKDLSEIINANNEGIFKTMPSLRKYGMLEI